MEVSKTTFHIIGDAYLDYIALLDSDWPEKGGDSHLRESVQTFAGGSAVNTATHLQHMIPDRSVTLYTSLNKRDESGQKVVAHVQEYGFRLVNCRSDEDTSSTGQCVVIVAKGERSFMTHQGCMANFSMKNVPSESMVATEGAVHVHVAGYFNVEGFWDGKLKKYLSQLRIERRKRCPDSPTIISLVTQHDATNQWDGGLDELLPFVDFLIVNELEAISMSRTEDVDLTTIAKYFQIRSPQTYIVVTRGEHGAALLQNGAIITEQKAAKVTSIEDPTGAGDGFAAGFIYGMWNQGDASSLESIKRGLKWGCAVGTAAVMRQGASNPSRVEEIEKFLQ